MSGSISKTMPSSDVRYNADTQIVEIGSKYDSGGLADFTTKKVESLSSSLWRVATTENVKLKRSVYTASNAFGVKTDVLREEDDVYGVAFDQGVSVSGVLLSKPWPQERVVIRLKMLPDEARSAKNNLRVVIVGSLIKPYAAEFDETTNPEIRFPLDATKHNKVLTVKTECAALVNYANGRLVYRVK